VFGQRGIFLACAILTAMALIIIAIASRVTARRRIGTGNAISREETGTTTPE
jgi:hypothetical protein